MLKKYIPALEWLPQYDKANLRGDFSAGLIVAIMLIPQGMAYAMLAGLPPVIGLYAATVPLMIYALFGTSRQLAVGPVAVVSLLVLSGVSTIAEPGTSEYITYVLLLMLMVGVIQFLMGVLRLGFLVNFLSHAVISAFTSAAAIIIGLSQLKHLIGVKIEADKNIFLILLESTTRIQEVNPITLTVGTSGILILILMKKYLPKVPAPLVVVGLSILIVQFMQLNHAGVSIVGHVPEGLPALSIPAVSLNSLMKLFPVALTIALIGFMESIAMAKAIAAKEKYKVDPNKELIGLGLANVGGSFFSGYPVTGGFSRSAVNYQSGAKTPLASFITAVLILLSLLFFTGFFYYLPNAVLAAIIMVAVYKLIDVKEAKHLFQVRSLDGWTWMITFIGTLAIGVEQGILIGVVFSLLVYLWKSAYPHMAELGFLENEKVFRNIKRYPEAKVNPEVMIFRIDSDLFFANMTFLEDKLCEKIQDKPDTKWIVLDFSGVNAIDAVSIHAFEEMMESCGRGEIEFLFAGVKGPVRDLLIKAHWEEKYGDDFDYMTIEHALSVIEEGGSPWKT